jgi:uncharacterized hydantoinase/oxoprolinase family protein
LMRLLGDGAAELFATTLDLYLVLGWIAEDPNDRDTADGRPATKRSAYARIARMICADPETCSQQQLDSLKHIMLARHVYQLVGSLEQVVQRLSGPPQTVILAGSGEFLANVVLREQKAFPSCGEMSLSREFGPAVSAAACAHAVAVLAAEEKS